LLNQKKIKLDVKVHSELVLIDLNLFSRVMINLLSNAIKFSYPESKIWVRSELLKNGRVEISVKDNGIGFDKEIISKLFTFREKVSRHGTAGERGTGLGLSLCKDMVNILGGNLKIISPAGSSNKKAGSIVSFDVKLVEPKIFISQSLKDFVKINSIKKKLNDYKVLTKDAVQYLKNEFKDYFVLIVLHESDLSDSLIEIITNAYKTKKNIIVVGENHKQLPEDLKTTSPESLTDFLLNELMKIEFEWKQQESLAKQMKKMWA
jgi:DNA topoisomerase VI subunit B